MSEHRARSFVLGRTLARESDLRVMLLTEHGARIAVLAHGAQRSSRRFPAGLMPLAMYDATWTEGRRGLRLDEALVLRAWPALLDELRRNTAAVIGTCVSAEMAESEPGDGTAFLLLGELFEDLSREPAERAAGRLVRFAFESLSHSGSAVALDRCVRCDTPAPEGALVTVDPREGGVVCRGCGGGPYRLRAADRSALRRCLAGEGEALDPAMILVCASIIRGVSERAAEHLERGAAIFGASRQVPHEARTKAVREGEG